MVFCLAVFRKTQEHTTSLDFDEGHNLDDAQRAFTVLNDSGTRLRKTLALSIRHHEEGNDVESPGRPRSALISSDSNGDCVALYGVQRIGSAICDYLLDRNVDGLAPTGAPKSFARHRSLETQLNHEMKHRDSDAEEYQDEQQNRKRQAKRQYDGNKPKKNPADKGEGNLKGKIREKGELAAR